LLDVLLFKLHQERLLLADRNVAWLARATKEIDIVVEQLRLTALSRAVEVDALAADLGIPAAPTLARLAQAAPSPWSELLLAHRAAYAALVARVRELASVNRQAIDDACRPVDEQLLALDVGR
jgi:hypothetical protein